MRKSYFLFILIALFSVAMMGCGGNTPNQKANNTNGNAVVKNTNNPLAVTTPTPESTTNNAPTLSPVYKAYCAAWVKRDELALKKVYTSAALAKLEKGMKADKAANLFDFIDEQVTADLCEVRNEQIIGDKGVAEVKTKTYPNGIKIYFEKENGEWKITGESPSLESVNTSSNSNAVKK